MSLTHPFSERWICVPGKVRYAGNAPFDGRHITTIGKSGKGGLYKQEILRKNQYNRSRPPLDTQAKSRLGGAAEVDRERKSMLNPLLIPH